MRSLDLSFPVHSETARDSAKIREEDLWAAWLLTPLSEPMMKPKSTASDEHKKQLSLPARETELLSMSWTMVSLWRQKCVEMEQSHFLSKSKRTS